MTDRKPDGWSLGVGPEPNRMEMDLELELYTGLFISAMRASLDALGSQMTMKRLASPFRLMGKSVYHFLIEFYPLKKDMISAAFASRHSRLGIGCRMGPTYITSKGCYCDTFECPYRDVLPEICSLICYYSAYGTSEEFDADLEPIIFRLEEAGRLNCRMIIKIKGAANEDSKGVGEPLACINLTEVSPEMRTLWIGALNGNSWIYVTNSLVEVLGSEKALEILGRHMRLLGNSLGLRLKNRLDEEGLDALAINHLMEELNQAGHQEGKVVQMTKDEVVKEFTACPLSGSPMEIGAQFESFANGVCEIINPDFEITHPQAMCRGDAKCIRVIARRSPLLEEGAPVSREQVNDDLTRNLALLKSRLAKGDISLEEYRSLREVLLE